MALFTKILLSFALIVIALVITVCAAAAEFRVERSIAINATPARSFRT